MLLLNKKDSSFNSAIRLSDPARISLSHVDAIIPFIWADCLETSLQPNLQWCPLQQLLLAPCAQPNASGSVTALDFVF